MCNLTGIKSIRFMKHVMDEIVSFFPSTHRRKLREEDLNEEEEEINEEFFLTSMFLLWWKKNHRTTQSSLSGLQRCMVSKRLQRKHCI